MDKKAGKNFGDRVDVIFCSAKVCKITAAKRKFCFDLVTARKSYLVSADTVRISAALRSLSLSWHTKRW
jgi:hypothetical protein